MRNLLEYFKIKQIQLATQHLNMERWFFFLANFILLLIATSFLGIECQDGGMENIGLVSSVFPVFWCPPILQMGFNHSYIHHVEGPGTPAPLTKQVLRK